MNGELKPLLIFKFSFCPVAFLSCLTDMYLPHCTIKLSGISFISNSDHTINIFQNAIFNVKNVRHFGCVSGIEKLKSLF